MAAATSRLHLLQRFRAVIEGTCVALQPRMGTHRTAWHLPFGSLIAERAPPSFHVRQEVRLTHEPQRARWWFQQFIVQGKEKAMVQKLEGYDEMLSRFIDGLTPEQRLKGLAPAQRLEGLSPEQLILAMPDEMLRRLPEDFLRSLSPATQQAIRARTKRRPGARGRAPVR